jgi:hypothetical protein
MIVDFSDGLLIEGSEGELRGLIALTELALEGGPVMSTILEDTGVCSFVIRLAPDDADHV